MVPVLFEGKRIGRLNVDIPWSQRSLRFVKMDFDDEAFDRADDHLDAIYNRIYIELSECHLELPESTTFDMNTTAIQEILISRGVPYPSGNLKIFKDAGRFSTIYSWRVAKVTLPLLEEIFDLDEYVPE